MPSIEHNGASIYYEEFGRTPCLVLAGNDEAHPYAISEEVAKLLPGCEFVPEWKEGAALAAAKVRIKEFLAKHTPR